MDIKKELKKKRTLLIIPVILLIIIIPIAIIVVSDADVTSGLEIEESIGLSYSEWNIGTQYQYTKCSETESGGFIISDSNIGQMAEAHLNFNIIDIGKIKMDMRATSPTSQNYFAMEFRSGSSTLFKLERLTGFFTLVVLDNIPMIFVDLEGTWQTIEVIFDLTEGENSEVSVLVDGDLTINSFKFDPNGKEINNIWMHTQTMIYKSRTEIKFEYLYNYLAN